MMHKRSATNKRIRDRGSSLSLWRCWGAEYQLSPDEAFAIIPWGGAQDEEEVLAATQDLNEV